MNGMLNSGSRSGINAFDSGYSDSGIASGINGFDSGYFDSGIDPGINYHHSGYFDSRSTLILQTLILGSAADILILIFV